VEVERYSSDLVEPTTRQNFAFWLATGEVLRGWVRSFDDTTEGISWIEGGIRNYRATGASRRVPFFLALKAEALHLADRTPEALETIKEAEALAERFEQRSALSRLHRLHGVFSANLDADETQIEASFREAIRIAREHKSVSLEKRAEATYADTAAKKRAGQRDVDSDYLFDGCLQRSAFR